MGEAKDNDVYKKELLDYEEEEEKALDSVTAKVSGEAVKKIDEGCGVMALEICHEFERFSTYLPDIKIAVFFGDIF
ncbi:hypothetical protein ZIOFF_018164 [Zingiber officinale]|uniref:Uncharacterized protein n=1 Tax=Zingiber officinale TaxID=94328 RepID=A0A8J5LKW0_ZINOF|nr:hypothetical protein ZIOFF_018164 [Zingiber officinale]